MNPTLLHIALQQTAASKASNLALIASDGQHFNYAQMLALVDDCAASLQEFKPTEGSRIGIYLPKHLLSAVAPFAISAVGCVFVPINPLLTEEQVAHIVHDCEVRILITSPDRALRLQATLNEANVAVLLSEHQDPERSGSNRIVVWRPPDMLHEQLRAVSNQQSRCDGSTQPAAQTLAALLYTSGSTGKPKGVMVSHQNLLLGARSVNEYLGITPQDRILALLPFSFDYGLNQLISAVVGGACCVLFDYLFPQDVIQAIEEHKITGLAGVPTLWTQLANNDWPPQVTDSVRYLTNSGGHLPRPVLDKLRRVFPQASPVLMYGLTEAFRSTYLPPTEIDSRPNSIGVAIPNATIVVVNDQQQVAAADEEGELVHCGPLVAMGYWQRAAETDKVFRPLPRAIAAQVGINPEEVVVWSGDRVRRDADGFLYFLGRRDAMIKTSGYRVSSEEIEEILFAHDYVKSVAAVGLPDETLGHAIAACIIVSAAAKHVEETTLRKALLLHCRHHMPSYLIPRTIAFFKTLPLNANGKIDRKRLVAMLQDADKLETEAVS